MQSRAQPRSERFGRSIRAIATRVLTPIGNVLDRKRLVGLVSLAALLSLFLAFNRAPKLDTVRADLVAATSPGVRCFQGFCVENDSESDLLSRWWNFSFTYLKLVTVGMTFAFLVAGLTDAFLIPRVRQRRRRSSIFKSVLKGFSIGSPMTLCSACIVPVFTAFRKRGSGIAETITIVQASSTLNLPAVIMVAMVFSPLIAGSRIVLGLLGVLLIGPVIARILGERGWPHPAGPSTVSMTDGKPEPWRRIVVDGSRDWAKASFMYLVKLGPLMVLAGFVSALAIQWINPDTISCCLDDSFLGIAVAAALGVLINVPLMFEIPLVVALLLLGMGIGPAAALLFAAAAAGPITFWGLSKVMPLRGVAALGIATWTLALAGGLVVVRLGSLVTGESLTGLAAGSAESQTQQLTASARIEGSSAPAQSVTFTDVTREAGLIYRQYSLQPRGLCLLGVLHISPLVLLDGGLKGSGPGDFCFPERMSGGAAAADYDNDGYVDLYVTRLDAPDILFRNRGDGRFEDVTAHVGLGEFDLQSNGAAWLDIDNDGDMDLYLTTIGERRFYLFVNDGTGRFTEEALVRGAAIASDYPHSGFSVAVGDYDLDGWLDLHVTEWGTASLIPSGSPAYSRLLRNRGKTDPGHFEDVTAVAGVALDDVRSQSEESAAALGIGQASKGPFAFASAFTDLDLDGWPDLAIVSDYGHTRLFWNNGDGTFTDGTISALVGSDKSGMGSAFGDFDSDGDLDWFVSSIFAADDRCASTLECDPRDATGNRLYLNEGDRLFSDATDSVGVRNGGWGWGAVFLDYDNDGDLDLMMVNGMHHSDDTAQSALDYARFWVNSGTGPLRESARDVGLTHRDAGKGVLTFDYDRDGDLDLFIVNNGGAPRLYRNDGGNVSAWIRVRLVGSETNSSGIGATVLLTPVLGGPTQMREVGVGGHFLGQSEVTAHFGLGADLAAVDRITVTWPVTGRVTVLENVPAGVAITVREGEDGFYIDGPPS